MDFLNIAVITLVLWWTQNKTGASTVLATRSKNRFRTASNSTLESILKDFEDKLIVDMTSSSSELAGSYPVSTEQVQAFLRGRFDELNAAVRSWRRRDRRHQKERQQRQQQRRPNGLNEPTVSRSPEIAPRETSRQQKPRPSTSLSSPLTTTSSSKQTDSWWSVNDQRRRRPASSGRQQDWRHQRPSFDWDTLQYPSCPSRTQLVQLSTAVDINNVVVNVYQPPSSSFGGDVDESPSTSSGGRPPRLPAGAGGSQWFHTITCYNQSTQSSAMSSNLARDCPNCCIGIDHSRFASSCQQKQSHVMAVVRRPGEDYVWNWIRVDSSCSCAIAPLNRHRFRH